METWTNEKRATYSRACDCVPPGPSIARICVAFELSVPDGDPEMLNTLKKSLPILKETALTPRLLNFVRLRQSMLEASVRSSGLRERTVQLGPDRVNFWVGGRGPALVFLHGFGAHAVWQWYAQVEALSEHFRIIMPNLLWFGGSSSDLDDYSVEHQVTMVRALMRHLGESDPFHLCGLSYGGAVAAMLARQVPESVASLTLASSPAHAYTQADYDALCARFDTDDITRVFIPDTVEDVQRLLRIGYKRPPLAPRFALRQVLDVMYSDFREEKRALLRDLVGDMDRLTGLSQEFEGPVQLIWGREDEVFPLDIAYRLRDRIPQSSLEVIEDTRHAPNLERSREFNQALGQFLTRTRAKHSAR